MLTKILPPSVVFILKSLWSCTACVDPAIAIVCFVSVVHSCLLKEENIRVLQDWVHHSIILSINLPTCYLCILPPPSDWWRWNSNCCPFAHEWWSVTVAYFYSSWSVFGEVIGGVESQAVISTAVSAYKMMTYKALKRLLRIYLSLTILKMYLCMYVGIYVYFQTFRGSKSWYYEEKHQVQHIHSFCSVLLWNWKRAFWNSVSVLLCCRKYTAGNFI